MVTVELPGGVKAWEYPLPPEGFDPLEADHESLMRYGFPHRPRDPELLRLWKRALGLVTKIVPPRYEVAGSNRHHHGIRNDMSSPTWLGAEILSSPGQIFENVAAVWTVPNPVPDASGNWCYCSSWVGLGNASLQAGVEAKAVMTGGSIERDIYAWWEMLPAGEVPITSVPVSAGDSVICAIGATPAPTQQDPKEILGHIWFANLTTGRGTIIPAQTKNVFAATTAEWIVERPTDSAGNPAGPLARYGNLTFTQCSALMTGTKAKANLADGTNIYMTGIEGPLSYGEILDNSAVLCMWANWE